MGMRISKLIGTLSIAKERLAKRFVLLGRSYDSEGVLKESLI